MALAGVVQGNKSLVVASGEPTKQTSRNTPTKETHIDKVEITDKAGSPSGEKEDGMTTREEVGTIIGGSFGFIFTFLVLASFG